MEFDDALTNASWNFGPANPANNQYDFESVVLHEMGHALLLAHVIDENKIMHRFITNGATKRSPSTDEMAAVAAVNTRSTTNTNMCGFCPHPTWQCHGICQWRQWYGTLRQAVNDVCNSDTIVFHCPPLRPLPLPVEKLP